MKASKLVALVAVVALVFGMTGAGIAAAVATPKTVAGCANTKNGGYFRLLEAKNLPKSQWGKCRPNEVKVSFPTVAGATGAPGRGFDKPFKLTLSGGPALSCTWQTATETLACTAPTS